MSVVEDNIGMYGKICAECPVMIRYNRCKNLDCRLCDYDRHEGLANLWNERNI